MDNPETGDVSFEARGRTFTLRYTTAAFVALEAFLDRGIIDIFDELRTWLPKYDPTTMRPVAETEQDVLARVKTLRLGFMRAVFWAGFHDMHRNVSVDEAGEIMEEIGGMMAAYQLVAQGISSAKSSGGSQPRPPKGRARRRTGSAS